MPADFIPATVFVWPPVAPKPRPARKRKRRCYKGRSRKLGRRPFSEAQRTMLADRIEDALRDGRLDIAAIAPHYERLLNVLFPEDYFQPIQSLDPALTPPGSAERATEYARRARAGAEIFGRRDANPMMDDRLATFGKLFVNGGGARVLGWCGPTSADVEAEEVGGDD